MKKHILSAVVAVAVLASAQGAVKAAGGTYGFGLGLGVGISFSGSCSAWKVPCAPACPTIGLPYSGAPQGCAGGVCAAPGHAGNAVASYGYPYNGAMYPGAAAYAYGYNPYANYGNYAGLGYGQPKQFGYGQVPAVPVSAQGFGLTSGQ